jgi:putative ABC transport system ATP-binding protein
MIYMQSITKTYGKSEFAVHALKGVDLSIKPGEMVAIMGPSGSGKSTLLNILGLLDSQTSGEYLLAGKAIANYSQNQLAYMRNEVFGFVIQDFSLVDQYSVYQNVVIPLRYSNRPVNNKRLVVERVLTDLGIKDKMFSPAYKLSGGQKQRVAIARALVNNPKSSSLTNPLALSTSRAARK